MSGIHLSISAAAVSLDTYQTKFRSSGIRGEIPFSQWLVHSRYHYREVIPWNESHRKGSWKSRFLPGTFFCFYGNPETRRARRWDTRKHTLMLTYSSTILYKNYKNTQNTLEFSIFDVFGSLNSPFHRLFWFTRWSGWSSPLRRTSVMAHLPSKWGAKARYQYL